MKDKGENMRGAMPLDVLIRLWEEKLGADDPLNPPNLFGETIQDTIYYLKALQKFLL